MKVFSPSPPMADAARDFKGPAEIVFTRMPYLSRLAVPLEKWSARHSKTYAFYIFLHPLRSAVKDVFKR